MKTLLLALGMLMGSVSVAMAVDPAQKACEDLARSKGLTGPVAEKFIHQCMAGANKAGQRQEAMDKIQQDCMDIARTKGLPQPQAQQFVSQCMKGAMKGGGKHPGQGR